MDPRRILLLLTVVVAAGSPTAAQPAPPPEAARAAEPRWFKGNLHTHSLWSDGDDYPEMVADLYKRHGYHFLGISDHNVLQQGTRWFELKAPATVGGQVIQRGGGAVLEKYIGRFGEEWVEQREAGGKKEVRLKPLAEYRSLLEEPGRFLMIPSEEVSTSWKRAKTDQDHERTGPVHVNLTNVREHVPVATGDNALTIMQQTVDTVMAQREKTGQPMIPHVNHPNFVWGVTAEELMQVRNEKFFELYNGHHGVNNDGDATRLSMDAMWDVILAHRLTDLNLGVMYGMGVDDSHSYHTMMLGRANPFRGWIMVRARHLTAESIIRAMEAGEFYSSNGVTLSDVQRTQDKLSLTIQGEPGVTYTIQFIGTRKGFDRKSEVIEAPATEKQPRKSLPHRRYSKDVGAVLAEVKGTQASYTLKGDEIYVRAKVVSTKKKVNGSVAEEWETAWTQPLMNERK